MNGPAVIPAAAAVDVLDKALEALHVGIADAVRELLELEGFDVLELSVRLAYGRPGRVLEGRVGINAVPATPRLEDGAPS